MAYETFKYDVLVIGSGGAGLRAAIEASAAGVTVGVVCRSLLGKAHTVMAEGGVAAALGNVDDRDGWKVHFTDTMRGGQYMNNWRMAELHAKEAPDRVRELEAWGAVFDRTEAHLDCIDPAVLTNVLVAPPYPAHIASTYSAQCAGPGGITVLDGSSVGCINTACVTWARSNWPGASSASAA